MELVDSYKAILQIRRDFMQLLSFCKVLHKNTKFVNDDVKSAIETCGKRNIFDPANVQTVFQGFQYLQKEAKKLVESPEYSHKTQFITTLSEVIEIVMNYKIWIQETGADAKEYNAILQRTSKYLEDGSLDPHELETILSNIRTEHYLRNVHDFCYVTEEFLMRNHQYKLV